MVTFILTLQPTYYKQGFFNVVVDYDRYVRAKEGPIRLRLGRAGTEIEGKINRRVNPNGTARIHGGAKLRDWFQVNFEPMDAVIVGFDSPDVIVLEKPNSTRALSPEPAAAGRTTTPNAEDFERYLSRMLRGASRVGFVAVEINAGTLHRTVGGYPGNDHRMPSCCEVLRAAMRPGDTVVVSPPSGKGASLTIRFRLPWTPTR